VSADPAGHGNANLTDDGAEEVMARRHIDDPGAWLKAFGDNPRLHLSRPAPLASPPRLDDLAPTNKSIPTICHAKPPAANADLLAGASRVWNRSIQWVGAAAYAQFGSFCWVVSQFEIEGR
jgi:hypothetical protein